VSSYADESRGKKVINLKADTESGKQLMQMATTIKVGLRRKVAVNNYIHPSILNETSNKLMNTAQLSVLRRRVGVNLNTPTHLIYALAGELPPFFRSQILTAKYIFDDKRPLSTYQFSNKLKLIGKSFIQSKKDMTIQHMRKEHCNELILLVCLLRYSFG